MFNANKITKNILTIEYKTQPQKIDLRIHSLLTSFSIMFTYKNIQETKNDKKSIDSLNTYESLLLLAFPVSANTIMKK